MNVWMAWTAWFKRPGSRKARRSARRIPRDFADYGTAFGLDLSLTPETAKPNEAGQAAAARGAAPALPVATPIAASGR